jgi:CHASE3 domain sensor protein
MTHRRMTTRPAVARLLACALVVVIASLAVAGCGSSTSPNATLSKRAYIERFNTQQRAASKVFQELDAATRDPKAAQSHLNEFEALIAALGRLHPPQVWAKDHATMLDALREMRTSMGVIARAPASKTAVITTQVGIYTRAQSRFQAAVEHVNATR